MPRFQETTAAWGGHGPADREAEVEKFLEIVEYMRTCGAFDWTDETIAGIGDSIRERKSVSAGQKRALTNIWDSRIKDREFGDME